jgi:hypothetical protein
VSNPAPRMTNCATVGRYRSTAASKNPMRAEASYRGGTSPSNGYRKALGTYPVSRCASSTGPAVRCSPTGGTPGSARISRSAASSGLVPKLCSVNRAVRGPCAVPDTPERPEVMVLPTHTT